MTQRKQEILEQLHDGIVTVVFDKVNGERREMRCTLNEGLLPPRQADNLGQTRKENPNNQSVWDVDKQSWRSFKWENVIDDVVPIPKEP